jgi:Fe-S cluster biogenesis protein NfuA
MHSTAHGPISTEFDHINVDTVPTPNPDALMFKVTEALVPTGTFEYARLEDTGNAPLAEVLLTLTGIELVLIAPRFVTIRKHPEVEWPALVPSIKHKIRQFLDSGEMAVLDIELRRIARSFSEVERRIMELIDSEIRPAIAQDGGDVTFVGFEDGLVQLKLIGACGTCPSALTTLRMGIERLLVEEIPEVRGVEQV